MQECSESASWRNAGSGREDDAANFYKSLQELRDLRPQLHEAAKRYESKFMEAREKRIVLDSTKEYTCRALVTVVDHLGSVSSQLNCLISEADAFSEAELRINSLKQRLLSCEHYVHKLNLPSARWNVNFPQLDRRYLSAPAKVADKLKLDAIARPQSSPQTPSMLEIYHDDLPLFLYTYTPKPPLGLSSSRRQSSEKTPDKKLDSASSVVVFPVQDGFSTPSKGLSSTFDFQLRAQKHGRAAIFRKSANSGDILSLIRRNKRLK